jgi:hypothetical protein
MFNRLRYSMRVLSTRENDPFNAPDISFTDEKKPEISRISKAIAGLIEALVVSALVGTVISVFHDRLPFNKDFKVTGIAAAVVFIALVLYQTLIGRIHNTVEKQLRIGERIAPFFGRRITRVIDVIRS